MPMQHFVLRLLLVGGWLGTGYGTLLLAGCDSHQASPQSGSDAQSSVAALPDRQSPNLSVANQSLDRVASVPVVDSPNATTMTVTTSVSSTVAVPVNIQANDSYSIAQVGEVGHSATAIAAAGTMLDGISQAIEEPNPDVGFIRSMMAHHEGAIALAQIELRYGSDEVLRKLAQDIIVMRSNELRWMSRWLENHTDLLKPASSQPTPTPLQHEPQYTDGLKEMYEQMLTGINHPDPDIAFASSLIPHHKGAMAMAQVEFKYGNDDKARAFADSVITSQQSEIALLKDYLAHQAASHPPASQSANALP